MKKQILLLLLTAFFSHLLTAQIAVNNDGSTPDASAALDVKSTNKGLLIPRMTTAERVTIPLPATGLLVFDNTSGSFWFYDGTNWIGVGTQAVQTLSSNSLFDLDNDTKIEVEQTADEDVIHFNVKGTEFFRMSDSAHLEILNSGQSVFIGEDAGKNDDLTNNQNVFLGYQSGMENTTGSNNTAIGSQVLSTNISGKYNTGIGTISLLDNTSGQNNTATGFAALSNNITTHYNTATGAWTLYKNIGNSNTATGERAMYNNTTGNYNTANGRYALYTNVSGNYNSATAYKALYKNTGSYNNAVGVEALYTNSTGENNNAVGYKALYSNTSGANNNAVGNNALNSNTTGANNIAIGYNSLNSNTTGNFCTSIGNSALNSNTIANYNTSIGYNAMISTTIGGNNTAIGSFSKTAPFTIPVFGTIHPNNAIAIGYNASATGNQAIIGNSSVSTIGGYANWTNVSDGRFKVNVVENVSGLDFIMKLRPVTYNLDMNAIEAFLETPDSLRLPESEALKAAEVQSGFIAQEVEQAAQQVGYDFHGVDAPKNAKSHYGLRYAEFVVPMVKAMQEQQEIIEQQQKTNEDLQRQIDELRELIEQR